MKKIILILLMLFGMISLVSADLTDNNEAYWTLDNVLTDSTGNGNTLTKSGTTYTSSGKINGAYNFDGTNDYMSFTNPITNTDFTISTWIKRNDLNNYFGLIGREGTPNFKYRINSNTDGSPNVIQLRLGSDSAYNFNTQLSSTLNWYHIVLVRESNTMYLYVDGVKDTGSVTNNNDPTLIPNLYLGSLGSTSNNANGIIDEVGIWNKALSQSEITELYNSGLGLQYPFIATPEYALDFYNLTLNDRPYEADMWFNTDDFPVGGSVYKDINYKFQVNSTNTNTNLTAYYKITRVIDNTTFEESSYAPVNTIDNTTYFDFTSTSYFNELYVINFTIVNNETSTNTENFTFGVDNAYPVISVIGNISQDSFSVDFSDVFLVYDNGNSGINTCTINITYLSDNQSDSNFLINCSDTQIFTRAGIYNGIVTATDYAGNIETLAVNGTINPLVYIDFNNILTSALITDYSTVIYNPDGIETIPTINNLSQIVLSPMNNGVLNLGLHTIEFTKNGFNIENFTININESSGDTNYTFNVTPVNLFVRVFDGTTLSQIDFNVTISNSTDIQSFTNLQNLSKLYSEIPSGDITLTITSSGYSQGIYYNTLSAFTSLTFNVYLTPTTDSSVITFTVKDFNSNLPLENVLVEAKRIINNSLVTVQQSKTSSNGITYMYLNQLYDYQFIFTKDNYVMASVNSIPTTTTYTIKLKPDTALFTYIDGVSYKISPTGSVIIAPDNVTFSAFISGTSISYSNISIIADGNLTLFTDTSTDATGTTFSYDYEFLNTTSIKKVVVKVSYIINGVTKSFSKEYNVILIGNDEINALIDVGNDTSEEARLFKFIVMLTIFAAVIIASNRSDQARDYISGILLLPTIFFIFIGWISLLYGTVLIFVLMVLFMGGNKR